MKKPKAGSKDKEGESAEYKAFESLAKKVLSVPKTEIDRREAERKAKKPKS